MCEGNAYTCDVKDLLVNAILIAAANVNPRHAARFARLIQTSCFNPLRQTHIHEVIDICAKGRLTLVTSDLLANARIVGAANVWA